jgi:hypothetical protein
MNNTEPKNYLHLIFSESASECNPPLGDSHLESIKDKNHCVYAWGLGWWMSVAERKNAEVIRLKIENEALKEALEKALALAMK